MEILTEAITQAAQRGYQNIKRQEIADALGISAGLINAYYGTMPQLKRAVMRRAIRVSACDASLRVIAQGLAARDKQAEKAPDALKRKALLTLAP